MDDRKSKAVFVTGGSSGIGRHLTAYLAARGYPVYATARSDADLAELGEIDGVTPVKLDVRDDTQVQVAFDRIERDGPGLYGLVNNAGIGGLGLFSTWTDDEMLEIFDVNVFGPHRITRACLGMLVENKGRVVNIGSQGGMVTSKYFGPYTMTKFALEAYTESLSLELAPYGVHVSVVQPGGIVSKAGANAMPGTVARFERAEAPFDVEAQEVLAAFRQPPPEDPDPDAPESETNRKPSSPEIVAEAVYDALFSEKPKMRYLVGTKWEGDRVIKGLIDRLLDENNNPVHGYDRDELVGLLDEAMAHRSNGD